MIRFLLSLALIACGMETCVGQTTAALRANCRDGGYQDFFGNGSYCPVARNAAVKDYNSAFDAHSVCASLNGVANTEWMQTANCSKNKDDDWTHACVGPYAYSGTLYVIWDGGYAPIPLAAGQVYRMLWHSLTSSDNLQGCFSSKPVAPSECTARAAITRNCVAVPLPGISP